ncbi:sodium-coupled monocarboxylate transporter 1-like [Haliotis rufescens]|uniref:sodium-coupled monocarboxylate transporter 1-like n=1 Tax=Haliotis rufescens TaxID=6454 RepID=UPI00201EE5B5|nr:sodium-coupled monocarboxylate transporter 1-like [Haliotis rufescens]XP_046376523.2 sodium-coupled monocarboxylate transporter 1-like [Haliotis rufescens]XP_046376524.2 sodium-coupled monocarboxylate transporter 1-like [Haliotis rufescens]
MNPGDTVSKVSLHVADYAVLGILLAVSLSIGLYFGIRGRKRQTREEYLLGGRQMSPIAVSLSIFATYMSAVSLLGVPAEVYSYGTINFLITIGICLSYIMGYFTVVPLFYELRVTSIYQYFEMRFKSYAVRMIGVVLGILVQIMYTTVTLLSPAFAMQAAIGLPLWVSAVVIGGIGTVYTSLGGLKSVIWADVFQTVVIYLGLIAVFIKGIVDIGDPSKISELNIIGGRVQFETSADPRISYTVWSVTLGSAFSFFSYTFGQATIQRTGAVGSLRKAKLAYLMNIPMLVPFFLILNFTGMLIYAYFHSIHCDPKEAGFISNVNQIVPYYVFHILRSVPGLSGLYMATLFSGSLSTASSLINALSANTVEDLLKYPVSRFSLTEKQTTIVAKLSGCFYGALTVGLVYAAKSFPGTVVRTVISVVGACGGPVTGMFCLGASVPRANKYGALSGGLAALTVNLWLTIGSRLYGTPTTHLPPAPSDNCDAISPFNSTHPAFNKTSVVMETHFSPGASSAPPSSIYDTSHYWYGVFAMVIVMVLGSVVSYCTGSLDSGTDDPTLLFPFARRLWRMKGASNKDNNTMSITKRPEDYKEVDAKEQDLML